MAPAWSKQPLKGIFITLHILKTLAILPFLLIRYGPSSARPFPEWSLKQCVVNALVRQLLVYYTATRSTAMSIVASEHKKAKERYALAEPPTDADVYSGILSPNIAQPAPVGGLWYPALVTTTGSSSIGEEKVVLYLPGGGFVLAFGQEIYGKPISKAMSKYLGSRTFFAQYRLAIDGTTRFPAGLQDLVTFYTYIQYLGIKRNKIILA